MTSISDAPRASAAHTASPNATRFVSDALASASWLLATIKNAGSFLGLSSVGLAVGLDVVTCDFLGVSGLAWVPHAVSTTVDSRSVASMCLVFTLVTGVM